jgi:hypothetical protein
MPSLNSALDAWRLLKGHAECTSEIPHLRELMADVKRCEKLFAGHDGITLDYSRQVSRAPERAARCRAAQSHAAEKGKAGPRRLRWPWHWHGTRAAGAGYRARATHARGCGVAVRPALPHARALSRPRPRALTHPGGRSA